MLYFCLSLIIIFLVILVFGIDVFCIICLIDVFFIVKSKIILCNLIIVFGFICFIKYLRFNRKVFFKLCVRKSKVNYVIIVWFVCKLFWIVYEGVKLS